MDSEGQVYMQFGDEREDLRRDTLEDRARLLEAELAQARQRAEERFTRAMEEHYEQD